MPALEITDAEAAGLSELAALDLAMARDFAARAQAAEDPEVANDLARSYQRMARSYRQTLALKAKLGRERAEAARDAPPPKPGGQAVARRLSDLRTALLRVAWDEMERPEGPEAEPDLDTFAWERQSIDDTLAEERAKAGFCDESLDDHVARLGIGFRFDAGRVERWRDLPDPPQEALDFPFDDGLDWRSSA